MTGRLEEVIPLEAGHVRVYTCGPTVYNRAHIGNFRAYVFEDVLRRVLEQRFPRVTQVMNLTDVEDKIIRNATAAGHGLEEETRPWIEGFFADVDALGLRRADHYPRATEYIEEMVSLIERLEARGVTYRSEGSIYFHIAGFPGYGRLSGARSTGLIAGASGRVDADEYEKEDARDFALWKAVGAGEIGWDTRLGRGRPGWHIECSAMSMALLGESFDIHCGGVDNIFPHHENEIAQSEAATGRPFVRLWCHNAHLMVEGEKMSKSKDNFYTLHQVLGEHDERASAVRYLLAATAQYRKPLNYTAQALEAAGGAVQRLTEFADRLAAAAPSRDGADAAALAGDAVSAFDAALDDDLNLPQGMGVVFDAVREANRLLDAGTLSGASLTGLRAMLDRVDDVLGVLPLVEREREASLGEEERRWLDERAEARARRDWGTSDLLRERLAERGIVVQDTARGQRWYPAA